MRHASNSTLTWMDSHPILSAHAPKSQTVRDSYSSLGNMGVRSHTAQSMLYGQGNQSEWSMCFSLCGSKWIITTCPVACPSFRSVVALSSVPSTKIVKPVPIYSWAFVKFLHRLSTPGQLVMTSPRYQILTLTYVCVGICTLSLLGS